MSRRNNNGKGHKLDLKLNLSLPMRGGTSRRTDAAAAADGESSPSSCLTSENEQGPRCLNSPEATSMVLAACPRCLMYVMLSDEDLKCPKCKKAVILDFLHDTTTNTTGGAAAATKTGMS